MPPVVGMRSLPGGTVAVVDILWAEFRAVADREGERGIDGGLPMLPGTMVGGSLPGIGRRSEVPICGVGPTRQPHGCRAAPVGRPLCPSR